MSAFVNLSELEQPKKRIINVQPLIQFVILNKNAASLLVDSYIKGHNLSTQHVIQYHKAD